MPVCLSRFKATESILNGFRKEVGEDCYERLKADGGEALAAYNAAVWENLISAHCIEALVRYFDASVPPEMKYRVQKGGRNV